MSFTLSDVAALAKAFPRMKPTLKSIALTEANYSKDGNEQMLWHMLAEELEKTPQAATRKPTEERRAISAKSRDACKALTEKILRGLTKSETKYVQDYFAANKGQLDRAEQHFRTALMTLPNSDDFPAHNTVKAATKTLNTPVGAVERHRSAWKGWGEEQ